MTVGFFKGGFMTMLGKSAYVTTLGTTITPRGIKPGVHAFLMLWAVSKRGYYSRSRCPIRSKKAWILILRSNNMCSLTELTKLANQLAS